MLVKFCGILMLIILFIVTNLAPISHGLRCFECESSLSRREDDCHKVEPRYAAHHFLSWECNNHVTGPQPAFCSSAVREKVNLKRGCLLNPSKPVGCRTVTDRGEPAFYECTCDTDNCNAKEPGTLPLEPNANGTAVAIWKTCPNKSIFFVLTNTLINTILVHFYFQ